MFEQVLMEAAKTVPSLVVLAVVGTLGVKIFLAYLTQRETTFTLSLDKRDEAIEVMGEQCHEVQREGYVVLQENAKMLGRNAEALDKNTQALAKVTAVLQVKHG